MKFHRHPLLCLALLAFVLTRAVTPAGYMAGPLGGESPFVLCPSDAGSAAWLALGQDAHQHHHGHHEHGEQHAADTDCPLSGLGSPAYLETVALRDIPLERGTLALREPDDRASVRLRYQRPQTRAPPYTA